MADVRQYSKIFSCIYNELGPVGHLGRGTHYSVCRSVEWQDPLRRPLPQAEMHDFATIWDEDHDERVIEAIERILMAGLFSPVLFVGERKGTLTLIVDANFYFAGSEAEVEAYRRAVQEIANRLNDPWPVELGSFDREVGNPHRNFYEGLISDNAHRVGVYLANIDSLWGLGTKAYEYVGQS